MKEYSNIKNYARVPDVQELPSLIEIQSSAFDWFIKEGLLELFDEINPIESFNGNLKLYLPGHIPEAEQFGLTYWFEEPKYSQDVCLERDMSYAAPLYVRVALVNREAGDEVAVSDIFMGDFPLMTDKGTFVINGTERVVVSQLIRSPGVYFDGEEDRSTGRLLSNAKLIPDRGAWMEFETRKNDYLTIKFNRKRTLPVTVLLRALAAVDDGLPKELSPIQTGEDEEIRALFVDVDDDPNHPYLESTLKNEPVWDLKKSQSIAEAALLEFYRKMRPGDPATLDNAREYLESQLFDQRRYDLERVGRYKLNQRLGLDDTISLDTRTISKADVVALVARMISINNGRIHTDDIDHLGNRRVKTVGELIMNKLRIGLRRMERVVKERMSIREADSMTPVSLVNIRPIVAAVREFFGSSQLSQFMEQTNPLAELTHKRTLSALGPGGLRRERAGFDVRDVHHSHYGRICPIETPEGPNIGLIGRLASYARVNEYGFIETPYRRVFKSVEVNNPLLKDRVAPVDIVDADGKVVIEAGTRLTPEHIVTLEAADIKRVAVVPFVGTMDVDNPLLVDRILRDDLKAADGSVFEAGTRLTSKQIKALKAAKIMQVPVLPFVADVAVDDAILLKYVAPRDIYDAEGAVVIREGARFTQDNIARLKALKIKRVAVVPFSGSVEVDNPLLLGRRVRQDVKDANDKVVVAAGTHLTREHIVDMKAVKVKQVPVAPFVAEVEIDNPQLIDLAAREDIEDDDGNIIVEEDTRITLEHISALRAAGIASVAIVPFVGKEIEYLNADQEDNYIIAQANSLLNARGEFINSRVSARYRQGFLVTQAPKVDYIDIAPRQIVGISAALIPFLEHDDANRALMGSNMQRQAVPLLKPDVPVVSTGMEDQAAHDSGQVVISDVDGIVTSVQGDRIVVRLDNGEERRYQLRKYSRSNQSTCIDQKPTARKGERVTVGDVLADSSSTNHGNLALGHDVLVAFICWDGGNYEDALLISEDMLRNDKFTSIHIEKHEVEARDTKLGPEEITYDIPNVGEDALKDLDEFGIVRVGAEVGPNDILVGKITPKGEKELSPEEKLLRAIFGEQAREVKDSSLRLPHGDRGKVVDVKTFTREEHPDLPAGVEKMVRVSIAQRRKLTVGDKMAGRHGNKGVISRIISIEDLPHLADGTPVEIILNPTGVPGRMNIGQVLELHLGWAADRLGFRAVTPVFDGADEPEIQADLGRAWLIDHVWKLITERAWAWVSGQYDPEDLEDDEEVRRLYISAWLGNDERYDPDLLVEQHVYARRAVLAEWLREEGYDPDDYLSFETEGVPLPKRQQADQNAIKLSLKLWIEEFAPDLIEVDLDTDKRDLFEMADRIMFETGHAVPHYGKQRLIDGRTGDPFDRHVAVGIVHMLKLAHLVEDKAHARSTGPYSLVTQQPLGGKAQFGGQRFGEMEVWALEAYGAAYTLQEMLTVKSDDVQGRVKTYESIVKGEPIEEPGIPTSFRVLVKELQSLGLAVEAITTDGDIIRFGKDEEQSKKAQPDTGLMSLGVGDPNNLR